MEFQDQILTRHLTAELIQHLSWSPVVVVTGARTCGKSTMLRLVAAEHAVPVIDLDDTQTRDDFSADIPGFLESSAKPVCIDEFQHNLEVLDNIKSALNVRAVPGQYVLTGSTRYMMLPHTSQSLTGRVHIMNLWPLSQGELRGHRETFIDTVFEDPESLPRPAPSNTTRAEYEDSVLAGGFPMALERPAGKFRNAWFRDFVNLVIKRDVLPSRQVRDRQLLVDLVGHLAANSAQVLETTRLADATGQKSQLIHDLVTILESVFIFHRLPAFGANLGAKVRRRPKMHMVDTGLAASLLGITSHKLRALQHNTLVEFGHLTETFIVNELMKQSGWAETHVEFSHFRTSDDREVDVVMETDDGRVIGIEVKAGSKVKDTDFSGMRMLRDRLGDRFVCGIMINLGQRSYRYDDDLYVIPADRMWAPR